jgi:hypothetical protein
VECRPANDLPAFFVTGRDPCDDTPRGAGAEARDGAGSAARSRAVGSAGIPAGVPTEAGVKAGVLAPAAVDAGVSTVAGGEAGVSATGGELGVSTVGSGEIGVSIAAVAGDEPEGVAGCGSLGTIKTKAASIGSAATMREAPMLSQKAPRRETLCRFCWSDGLLCWSGGAPCHNQSPETPSSGTVIKAGGSVMISPWPRCLEQGDPLQQDDRLQHANAQPDQLILAEIIASELRLAPPANRRRPGAAADRGDIRSMGSNYLPFDPHL